MKKKISLETFTFWRGGICSTFSLIIMSHILAPSIGATYRSGCLLFKRTGVGGENTGTEWLESDYSDHSDLDIYRWDLKHMFGWDRTFRSPLLEHWTSADMVDLSIGLFNADGQLMDAIDFNVADTGANINDFTDYLTNSQQAEVVTRSGYGAEFVLRLQNDITAFKLAIMNVTQTDGRSERFVLGTGYSGHEFMPLHDADHLGCYKITYSADAVPLDDMYVYQCVYNCLATADNFVALYIDHPGSHATTYCQCLSSAPTSTTGATCDSHCNGDGLMCGQMIDSNNPPTMVSVSVYDINSTRQYLQEASDFTDVTGWQHYMFRPSVNTVYSAHFGNIRYIRTFAVRDTSVHNFTMATTIADCTDTPTFTGDEFRFLHDANFSISVFSSMSVIELEPVPAMCVLINFTGHAPDMDYHLDFQFVQNDYVMAEYFAIHGSWKNRECAWLEVMQYPDVIENSDVALVYGSGTDLVDDGGVFKLYQSTVGKVEIRLPDFQGDEYWIKNITVTAPFRITLEGTLSTKRMCTDHTTTDVEDRTISGSFSSTGSIVDVTFPYLGSSYGMFCGEAVDLRIRAGTVAKPNKLFSVTVSIFGCIIKQGSSDAIASTCIHEDFVQLQALSGYMSTRMVPLPDKSATALRSTGSGLMVAGQYQPTLTVTLAGNHDTELQRMTLKSNGSLLEATFHFAGVSTAVSKDGNDNLSFEPNTGMDRVVMINNFIPDNSAFIMTVELVICTNYLGYFYSPATTVDPNTATSSGAGTTLTNTGTASANTGSTPVNPGTTLANTGSTPVNPGTTPANTGSTPVNPGFTPANTGSTPVNPGTTPKNTGSTPVNPGTTPANTGSTPVNPGTTPANPGPTPANQGSTLANQGSSSVNLGSTLPNQGSTTANKGTTLVNPGSTLVNPGSTSANPGPTSAKPGPTSANPGSTLANQGSTSSGINHHTTTSSNQGPVVGTTVTPAGCCCGPLTNLTVEQVDQLVKELIKNLTVPKENLSAFKRRLISAPDARPSAKYVGCTCGVVFISLSFSFLVAIDLVHIKSAINMAMSMFRAVK